MVNFCAVVGCTNKAKKGDGKSFFRLPAVITHLGEKDCELSKRRQDAWLARIRRQDLKPESYATIRVCSDHFVTGRPATLYDTTHQDWAPSLSLGYNAKISDSGERCARAKKRCDRKRASVVVDVASDSSEDEKGKEVQTAVTHSDITALEEDLRKLQIMKDAVDKEVGCLQKEVQQLKSNVEEFALREDSFKGNDDKVRFYTGLSCWQLLFILLEFIETDLKHRSNLTPFQQLLLTLMRLRLNLSGQDLAYRFRVHKSTISRTFLSVIQVLYTKLQHLILWPERDVLRKTMPMDFRKHSPNCVVIIDCFEILLDRPTNLLARAQTYSSYKHHNTVKYLIGITPQGTVSFISEGWGGRVSDKHLTENCRFLDNLLPGDTVLADRGFDIKELVGSYCATLKIPAFTKGKAQLTGIEVEQTRRIANVRIHVERVIGNLRQKYSLLSGVQPIDFVTVGDEETACTLDKIVCVACALINMCDSVVPYE